MKNIAPCPLCGSNNIVIDTHNYTTEKVLYTIHCKGCGLAITRESSEQAIKDWNKKCEEYEYGTN